MPELPDLQVFSRNLQQKLEGKTVQKVHVGNSSKLKVPVKELQQAIEQQTLKKVYREGKELHIAFEDGTVLGMHLMLHGQLHLFEGKNPHKHEIISLQFDDGTGLALTDYQGAANATLNPEEKTAPDALSKEADLDFLKERLSKTRTTIKNFLLDQKVIRGIGNAYADEILWDARISPFSVCNKIPPAKIKDLAKSIRTVLKDAEKHILKNHPDLISGEIRDFMQVHNARRKTSPGGAEIQHKSIGGRKTYFTDEQELYK